MHGSSLNDGYRSPLSCRLAQAEQKVASAKRLQWAAAAAPAGAPEGTACREFTLEAPLKKGQTAELTAYGAHTRVLRPDPAQVRHGCCQLAAGSAPAPPACRLVCLAGPPLACASLACA